MIRRQLGKVGKKFKNQADLILGKKRAEKRDFINAFVDNIVISIPGTERDVVAIIVTAFLSELRSVTPDIRAQIIRGD